MPHENDGSFGAFDIAWLALCGSRLQLFSALSCGQLNASTQQRDTTRSSQFVAEVVHERNAPTSGTFAFMNGVCHVNVAPQAFLLKAQHVAANELPSTRRARVCAH